MDLNLGDSFYKNKRFGDKSGRQFSTNDRKQSDWRTHIKEFLTKGTLPEEKRQARRLHFQASGYVLIGEELFKKSWSKPLLRCLSINESQMILSELHDGEGSTHCGYKSLIKWIIGRFLLAYYPGRP